jgi:hypothetical protein
LVVIFHVSNHNGFRRKSVITGQYENLLRKLNFCPKRFIVFSIYRYTHIGCTFCDCVCYAGTWITGGGYDPDQKVAAINEREREVPVLQSVL